MSCKGVKMKNAEKIALLHGQMPGAVVQMIGTVWDNLLIFRDKFIIIS